MILRKQTTHIIIHHTASLADNNSRTFEAVRRYHMKVKGWTNIGYHYFIETLDGRLYRGRSEEEVGTHCKEQSMNYKSIGICLEGYFDKGKDIPTVQQLETLKKLIFHLRTKYNIPRNNIKFHRDYAINLKTGKPYKTCPGSWWTHDFLNNLMNLQELKRDRDGGFWFCKKGGGKQKINDTNGINALLTILSREFGVENVKDSYLENLKDKKYF